MPKKVVVVEDANVVGGMPEDGDVIDLGNDDGNEGAEPNGEKPVVVPKAQEPDWAAELAAVNQKLARLEGENAALRAPKQQAQPAPQEPNWEDLLFTDTNKAVALLKKTVREEITNDLTSQYKRDKGETQFWDDFYKDHDDLKHDDDLVKTTLQSHMSELADLPVKKAAEKLAELTRTRILRYTNGTTPKGKKAVTEGASQPSGGKKVAETPKPLTLSDIIRARREKRYSKATTA